MTTTRLVIYWVISWIAICRADHLNPFDDHWEMVFDLAFGGILAMILAGKRSP